MQTILIIEDSNLTFLYLKKILSIILPEALVVRKDNGLEGLNHLLDHSYDLIFCDHHLPGKNGLEIVATSKAQKPQLKFIAISSDDSDNQNMIKAGALLDFNKDKIFEAYLDHLDEENSPLITQLKKYIESL